jgi:hypothetical protein
VSCWPALLANHRPSKIQKSSIQRMEGVNDA